jgi:hypothetical protein
MNVRALRSFLHEWRPVFQGVIFVFLVVSTALLYCVVLDLFVRFCERTTAEAEEKEKTEVLDRKLHDVYVKVCDQEPTWVPLREGPDDGVPIGTTVTVHYGVGKITNSCYAIDVTIPPN